MGGEGEHGFSKIHFYIKSRKLWDGYIRRNTKLYPEFLCAM
jgi:hypothetical protein